MAKYRVYGIWTASKVIGEYEADSQEEAEQMALNDNNNHASLCHHCAHEIELSDYTAQEFEVEEIK